MIQTRRRAGLVVAAALGMVIVGGAAPLTQQPAPAPQPPRPATQEPVVQDPFDQAAAIADLQRQIAGREDLPATDVFMNITQYKGVTAGRLLRIMDHGFSRGLGVTCTHCHIAGEWDSDDKVAKQTAREMSRMMTTINTELLRKIPNLRSTNPAVNCTTCHRGQIRPALELSASPRRGGVR